MIYISHKHIINLTNTIMKTSKEKRLAAQEIYDRQSVNFSNCYELEGLKEIKTIFLPSDAPAYVLKQAEFLQAKVRQQYHTTEPEIVKISPLFKIRGLRSDIANRALIKVSKYLRLSNPVKFPKSVILCPSELAIELILKMKKYIPSDEFIPLLICDEESFDNCSRPLEKVAQLINVSLELISHYGIYRQKLCKDADFLVVLASGYESWDYMIDLWHQISYHHGKCAEIIYVEDLENLTSPQYAEQIYAKFEWLIMRSKIPAEITKITPNSVKDIKMKSIFCIPQQKSYWFYKCKGMPNISFYIIKQNFAELWSERGAIGRHYLCQDLRELEKATQKKSRLDEELLNKRFNKWRLNLFWWKNKIKIKNHCWISFLNY